MRLPPESLPLPSVAVAWGDDAPLLGLRQNVVRGRKRTRDFNHSRFLFRAV